jgi:hypothetical protein
MIEKIRVLGKQEPFEMEVVVIDCIGCGKTLGVFSVPLKLSDFLITQSDSKTI